MKDLNKKIKEWLNHIGEPAKLTWFEIISLSMFITSLFLFMNLYLSLMSIILCLFFLVCYDRFIKKGKSKLWNKVKI